MKRILLVDNYDSFTYNLAHLFGSLGAEVAVLRNDDPRLAGDDLGSYGGIAIGPGPGRPRDAGYTFETIRKASAARLPLFGVCLGLQAIGEFFGGTLSHAPRLMHGKTSPIEHDGSGIFSGVPSPFSATRYHSLCLLREGLPPELRVTARNADDDVIAGIAHRALPIAAVQFHPESVLTPAGPALFANFLETVERAET
ncbi:MAG TPA: aminodeoxychorismate/anthranilate synthase component II [Candidatus Baltobacteraceae bacterium]|nr:aminodeoxychorismate/anthranilate synthase component II [Candidatus Baltobacteraceae bacterium]